jgi:hypothetical protein
MVAHGLTERRRAHLIAAMIAKGARLPSRTQYEEQLPYRPALREIENFVPRRRGRKATPVKTPVRERKAMVKAVAKAVAEAKAKNPPVKVKKGPMLRAGRQT